MLRFSIKPSISAGAPPVITLLADGHLGRTAEKIKIFEQYSNFFFKYTLSQKEKFWNFYFFNHHTRVTRIFTLNLFFCVGNHVTLDGGRQKWRGSMFPILARRLVPLRAPLMNNCRHVVMKDLVQTVPKRTHMSSTVMYCFQWRVSDIISSDSISSLPFHSVYHLMGSSKSIHHRFYF